MQHLEIRVNGRLKGLPPTIDEVKEAVDIVLNKVNSALFEPTVEVRVDWNEVPEPEVELEAEDDCAHCDIPIRQDEASGEYVHTKPLPDGVTSHFAELYPGGVE